MEQPGYEVLIISKEGEFARFDFPNFAFTIFRRKNCVRIIVSIKDNPLLDYVNFRESMEDEDEFCSFLSKQVTLRNFREAESIARNYQSIVKRRFLRFMKNTFPEYASLCAS